MDGNEQTAEQTMQDQLASVFGPEAETPIVEVSPAVTEEATPVADSVVEASVVEPSGAITPNQTEATAPPQEQAEMLTPETSTPETPPISDLDALRQQVEQLSAQLLAAQTGVPSAPPVVPTSKDTPAPVPVQTQVAIPPQAAPLLTQEDYVKAITSPEGFVEVMSRMQTAIAEDLRQNYLTQAVQQATSVAREEALRYAAVQQFFTSNPMLTPYKSTCALVANELAAQNPAASMDAILAQTAAVVKARYGIGATLRSTAGPVAAPTGPKPGFVGGSTARGPKGQALSPQQALIQSTLSQD